MLHRSPEIESFTTELSRNTVIVIVDCLYRKELAVSQEPHYAEDMYILLISELQHYRSRDPSQHSVIFPSVRISHSDKKRAYGRGIMRLPENAKILEKVPSEKKQSREHRTIIHQFVRSYRRLKLRYGRL